MEKILRNSEKYYKDKFKKYILKIMSASEKSVNFFIDVAKSVKVLKKILIISEKFRKILKKF